MSEYTKPKYKNLIDFLHSRNHYLDVDAITAENRVEILSNFIMNDKKCNTGGKCFCSRVLKNVFWVDCILTNEPMMVGGGCKSLFTTRNKKKKRQQFLDRTLHLFKNNLGWERIIDWNDFIGQSLNTYLRNSSYTELKRLKELYTDNQNILDRIEEYIGGYNNNPNYPYFLDNIENDEDMGQYIVNDDYKNYWLKYLRENLYNKLNILVIWYSKNRDVYNYIKPLFIEAEKPKNYELFLSKKISREESLFTDEGMELYSDCWKYYLKLNYKQRNDIFNYWSDKPKLLDLLREKLAEIEIGN